MARARTHTLNERHLAVLQWFDAHSVRPESPEGWCSEKRVETHCRVNGQKLAIGEALHDLTIKLNNRDDPFLITHPSGKHYRISEVGRKLARACTTAKRMTERGEVTVVVDRRTKAPPVIRMQDDVPVLPPDMEDDDELPPTDSPRRADDTDDADTAEVVDLMPIDDDPEPEEPKYDEINDAPATRQAPPKRNPAKAPAKRKAMPAIGKPATS